MVHLPHSGCDFKSMSVSGPKRQALRRFHTSEIGGEADMPRQLNRRNDGGQAIVGDVVQTPRPGNRQLPTNAKEALTDVRRPPMRLLEDIKGPAARTHG
jgi:hypothetical protein